MPEVIELRVHGVGGSPPESLLGVATVADCVIEVDQGETAFVSRRADRHVQGYIWGGLTERPFLQPFWLFLLPFTLVSVSGWMHRPFDELRGGWRGWVRIFRVLVLLIGALFTASYFVWLSNVVINRLYHGQTQFHFAWGPRTRIVVGAAIVTLLLGVVYVLAHARQLKFEAIRPPRAVTSRPGATGATTGDAEEPHSGELILSDARFWNRPGFAKRSLAVHVLIGLASVAGVTAWSWVHSSPSDVVRHGVSAMRALGIAGLATYTTEFALWAIVALTVVDLVGWHRPAEGAIRFRWLGPTSAATTGVAYGTMFLYALPLLFGAHSGGRVAIMAVSFGIGTLAIVAAGAGLAVWFIMAKRRELKLATSGTPPFVVPPNPSGRTADEPRGATPEMYGRIATSRARSEAGRNGTVALTASALGGIL